MEINNRHEQIETNQLLPPPPALSAHTANSQIYDDNSHTSIPDQPKDHKTGTLTATLAYKVLTR
jgi:hypothetical protein